MITSKLRIINGVTYNELKSNIKQVLNNIIKILYIRSYKFIKKKPPNRIQKLKNYL